MNFLKDNILPAFIGSKHKNIIMAIFNLDGKLEFSTNKYANIFGFNDSKDIIGLNNIDLFKSNLDCDNIYQHLFKEINQFKNDIIKNEKPIDFLLIGKTRFLNSINIYEVNYIPLFNHLGIIVGIQSYTRKYTSINFRSIINNNKKVKIKNDIKLSIRQREILILLLCGLSQNKIAEILNITRGTISKIIADEICPKFDICGSSATFLVEKIIKTEFNLDIPKSFMFPKIIKLNYETF